MPQGGALDALIRRPRPTAWEQFCSSPVIYIVKTLYAWRRVTAPPASDASVTVACISDTHNHTFDVPPADILVHAGDLTQSGTIEEIQRSLDWISAQPHQHKIVVAGNHDVYLDLTYNPQNAEDNDGHTEDRRAALDWKDIIYLEDESAVISCQNGRRRLKIYGSPRSPKQGNWAFQYPRTRDLWRDAIPPDVDILITHCPPAGHLDLGRAGCIHLLDALWCCRPRLHVFGHIHEGHGTAWLHYDALQRVYETTMQARGGLWNLFKAVASFVGAILRPGQECQSLLVNAAMVQGLRDDKTREPVLICI